MRAETLCWHEPNSEGSSLFKLGTAMASEKAIDISSESSSSDRHLFRLEAGKYYKTVLQYYWHNGRPKVNTPAPAQAHPHTRNRTHPRTHAPTHACMHTNLRSLVCHRRCWGGAQRAQWCGVCCVAGFVPLVICADWHRRLRRVCARAQSGIAQPREGARGECPTVGRSNAQRRVLTLWGNCLELAPHG